MEIVKTKPRSRTKTVEFPKPMEKRATLALHALEGVPDEMLRAVARQAPGERVRVLAESSIVKYAPGERVEHPTGAEGKAAAGLEARVALLEEWEHERALGLAIMLVQLSAEVNNVLSEFSEKAADKIGEIATKVGESGSARTRAAYSDFINNPDAFLAKWAAAHGKGA